MLSVDVEKKKRICHQQIYTTATPQPLQALKRLPDRWKPIDRSIAYPISHGVHDGSVCASNEQVSSLELSFESAHRHNPKSMYSIQDMMNLFNDDLWPERHRLGMHECARDETKLLLKIERKWVTCGACKPWNSGNGEESRYRQRKTEVILLFLSVTSSCIVHTVLEMLAPRYCVNVGSLLLIVFVVPTRARERKEKKE